MTTLYLHIGTPKTGTSFMQYYLSHNREALDRQGYAYPIFEYTHVKSGRNRNGQFLIDKYDEKDKYYKENVQILYEVAKEYPNIILSEEALWNNNKLIPQFLEDMKKADVQVKILVYLRRQDLYLQSQWAQDVKETKTVDFYTFSKKTKIQLDFYPQLCKFRDMVGAENLIVRVYERQQFSGKNHDLCSDFLETVGVDLNEEFESDGRVKNPSLNGIYLETKRLLNRHEEFATKANFVVPYIWEVMQNREAIGFYTENKYFTYEQQMEFLSKYEESNAKVAREFLHREDGILFKAPIEKSDVANQKYTLEEYVDVLAEIMLVQQGRIDRLREEVAELRADVRSSLYLRAKRKIRRMRQKEEELEEE